MAQFIIVKPSRPDLIVLDDHYRRIPWKEDGHRLQRTTLISRSIKEGDLIWVDKKELAEAKAKVDAEAISKSKKALAKVLSDGKKNAEETAKKLVDQENARQKLIDDEKAKASNKKNREG